MGGSVVGAGNDDQSGEVGYCGSHVVRLKRRGWMFALDALRIMIFQFWIWTRSAFILHSV